MALNFGKKNKNQAAKLVVDELRNRHAFTKKTAVEVSAFKNLPLSTETIAYTIADFYEKGIIVITDKNKYYFDQEAYDKFSKKTVIQLRLLLALPVALFIIFFLVYGGF